MPSDFDDSDGDWRTVLSSDLFERLYLDRDQPEKITHDVVERHAALLIEFWNQKVSILSQGAAKQQIVRKFGDGNESKVRNYADAIREARVALQKPGGVAALAEQGRRERLENCHAKLDEAIRLALSDGQLAPAEAKVIFARAEAIGLTLEETRSFLLAKLHQEDLQPVSGRFDQYDPFAQVWEISKAPPHPEPHPEPVLVAAREAPTQPKPSLSEAVPISGKRPVAKWLLAMMALVLIVGVSAWLLVGRTEPTAAPIAADAAVSTPLSEVPPENAMKVDPPVAAVDEPAADVPLQTTVAPVRYRSSSAQPEPAIVDNPTLPSALASVESPAPTSQTVAPGIQSTATDPVAPEPAAPVPTLISPPPAAEPPPPVPEPPSGGPVFYQGPLAGTLNCSGPPVVQNGEVVFRNLPPTRLELTYDLEVWEARLSAGEGGTQRLVLRNRKPGTQRKCTVSWRVIPR